MEKKIALLWSGGLDSTVLACMLARDGFKVMPTYIRFRPGGGKEAIEMRVTEQIYPLMHELFPSISTPNTLRQRIDKNDRSIRNQRMIEILKDNYLVQSVAIGVYGDRPELDNDDSKEALSKSTGIQVVTFEDYGFPNKFSHAKWSKENGLQEILKKSWSCQMWFKSHCYERPGNTRICYSCKERQKYLGLMQENN